MAQVVVIVVVVMVAAAWSVRVLAGDTEPGIADALVVLMAWLVTAVGRRHHTAQGRLGAPRTVIGDE